MKFVFITAFCAAALLFNGCGESEETKANVNKLSKQQEEMEAKKQRQIEEQRKYHKLMLESYDKSMSKDTGETKVETPSPPVQESTK